MDRALVILSPHRQVSGCQTWDSNPRPSGYKSNSLSIRPRLPHCIGNVIASNVITSLHRKHYQRPLTIACECFDNMIKIKQSFPDKAWLNHLDLVQLHLSTNVFCELSMTLCLVYKNALINPQTRSRMPLKINYPLDPYAGILLISEQRRKRAVWTNVSKQTFFQSICPDDRLKRASVYCIQCRKDSGSDCNFYLFLMRRDTRIQREQVSAVKGAVCSF